MTSDLLFKFFRKSLPSSLYGSISKSIFGRKKSWDRIETYESTFNFYKNQGLRFEENIVVEVGSGDQYYTALFFLGDKAKKVILVEPKLILDLERLENQLAQFNRFTSNNLQINQVKDKIICYRDLSEIPSNYNSTINVICSYLVLEHFQNIESFFLNINRLLASDGQSCNVVDLSDHTYHVFAKYSFLKSFVDSRNLYHLRYSERLFRLLNDPKCFMNRILLPDYLFLAKNMIY